MSYFSPYYPYPFPMPTPTCGGFRNPMTQEEYSKVFEPPYPSGSAITPSTPLGPMDFSFIQEDMTVDNFINRSAGRNNGGGHIDNIIRLNRDKLARIRMTFNSGGNTSETKVFTGIIETAGRDHIILSDPQTGGRFLLLMVYLDYIEFPEEINYFYPGTNVLNIVDERVLEDNPEIMPLYQYQKAKKDRFIHHIEAVTLKNQE